MRKTANVLVIAVIMAIVVAALGACGGEVTGGQPIPTPIVESVASPTVTRNFEIDYTKIEGESPEERISSLSSLFNEKNDGYAKTFSYIQTMPTSSPEETGTVYMHVLMVYGDPGVTQQEMDDYMNGVFVMLKQLVVYTAKFVSDVDESAAIQVQISYPDGGQGAYVVDPGSMPLLRQAPSESWLQYAQPQYLSLVSNSSVQRMRDELGQVNAALNFAVANGYLTQEEINKMVEAISPSATDSVP